MKNELRKNWEMATEKMAQAFARHYFGKNAEVWWVAEEIGGVLNINDHFFNLNEIVDFLKYNYSVKKMFEYYDYALECHRNGTVKINIKSYRHTK